MVFAVVVDVPPLEAAVAAHTLATCNAALGTGQCRLTDANPDSENAPRWYAVVRFGTEGQARLTIELRERSRDGGHVASSELEFEDRDSPAERWASVGVVVAALVAAQPTVQAPAEPTRVPAPAGPSRALAVEHTPPVVARSLRVRLDLGITAGSELRNTPLRVGPLGRVGVAFASVPVFAFVSGAYTVRSSGNTDLNWLTGSLGVGGRVSFAGQRGALDVRAEAVLETLGIQATDGERSESARRTRVGPRVGLDLSGYWAKNWALVVGAEAGALSPRVLIEVAGQTEQLPPFVWGLLSAVRYDFR